MSLFATSNARRYAASLRAYAVETGKSFGEALAREGPDFKQELFNQFRTIRPQPEDIFNEAKGRGFNVRRVSSTSLVKTSGGLSARAMNRAKEILGDQKSDMFRWVGSRLAPVRFSGRGSRRILQGGRFGRRFAPSALRAYQLTTDQLEATQQTPRYKAYGVKRLNLRALAVYLELTYRKRAAAGGTMAVQWLHKTWRRSTSTRRLRQLVQRSATNVPIGTVDFVFEGEDLREIIFTGTVPGTAQQAEAHGILDKVFEARAPRLSNAVLLHQQKVARQRGLQ